MNIASYSIQELVILGLSVYFVAIVFGLIYIANHLEEMKRATRERGTWRNRNVFKVIVMVCGVLVFANIIAITGARIGWAFWFDGAMTWMILQEVVLLAKGGRSEN